MTHGTKSSQPGADPKHPVIGLLSSDPYDAINPSQAAVDDSGTELIAEDTDLTGRDVTIYIKEDADTGIYINVNGAATTDHFLLEPGKSIPISTLQAINAIRAGTTNVTAYILAGVNS